MSDAGNKGGEDAGQDKGDAGQQDTGDKTQKAIDAVVARERTRTEKLLNEQKSSFEGQIAELKGQLESSKGKGQDDETFKTAVANARKPVEDLLAAERSKRTALNDKITRAEIKSAASGDSVDPDAVSDLLASQVRINDAGEIEVVGKDGKPAYGGSGPKSVKELVTDLLTAKPYLAKSKARDGADINTPAGQRSTGGKTRAELQADIAKLEAEGKYDEALMLQSQLHQLGAPKKS